MRWPWPKTPDSLDAGYLGASSSPDKLTLVNRGVSISGFVTSVEQAGAIYVPHRAGFDANVPHASISAATFHIFNFPDFFGPDDYILVAGSPERESSTRCGRCVLKADGWVIEIAATDKTNSLYKELKREGGYALTHVGRVSREDGSTFSSEALDDWLDCIHRFLSFAVGRWVGVAFSVAFDAAENRVFEQWGTRHAAEDAWNHMAWFDEHHGELLTQVFSGFHELWKSPIWKKPLRDALYWYLGANCRRTGIGVDAGLILSQTALELLAWTYCVLDRKMVSASAFQPRGLVAADKLRLLLTTLNIPTAIPTSHGILLSVGGGKPIDGVDAITILRNALVHPDSRPVPPGAYWQACELSLWYIEQVLLRLCRHLGDYSNRLRTDRYVGTVDPMP